MRENGKTNTWCKEGGTRMIAALLGFLVLATVAVGGTYAFLYPRDTLARLVPTDAVAYVHYRTVPGLETSLLRAAFGIPKDARPAEAAIYAVRSEDGEQLRWATLVSWSSQDALRVNERLVMNEATSWEIADGVYLLGDPSLFKTTDESLENRVGNALAMLRTLAPIQAIFDPSVLSDNESITLPEWNRPYGAALSITNGKIRASVTPLAALQDASAILGYRLPDAPGRWPRHAPSPATVSLTEAEPSFDPLTLLFPTLARVVKNKGVPRDAEQPRAAHALREILKKPLTMDIVPNPSTGGYGFILAYPGLAKETLLAALRPFLQTILPETRSFPLPNGETAREFVRAKKDPFSYAPNGTATLRTADLPALTILENQEGTIIASHPSLQNKALGTDRTIDPDCPVPGSASKLMIRAPKTVFENEVGMQGFLQKFKLNYVTVSKYGENSAFVCGLIGGNVDNP